MKITNMIEMIPKNLRSWLKKNGIKQTLGWQNMVKTVNKRRAKTVSQTLSGNFGHCPVGGLWKCDFHPKSTTFFPNLILKL
jgi:hypothetical protein